MSAGRRYAEFHGHEPRYTRSHNFHVPRTLVLLGEAIAIEYRCDKLNGGGDGRRAVYRHEFEGGAILAMDERAGGQLYILGRKIKVTDAGIER